MMKMEIFVRKRQLRLEQNVYEERFESSSIFLRTQSDKNVQYFEMDMDFRQWLHRQ